MSAAIAIQANTQRGIPSTAEALSMADTLGARFHVALTEKMPTVIEMMMIMVPPK